MNQSSFTAITALLNAFPQSGANVKALLLTYEQALTGVGDAAVDEACRRFISGDVEGQSKTFAPSIAEFVTEARRRQEYIDLKARPRLPAPRYFPGPLAPFQVRQQKRLAENAHLPVLHENIAYDQFRKMSAAKEIPVGAKWTSAGIIYGPDPKQKSAAA